MYFAVYAQTEKQNRETEFRFSQCVVHENLAGFFFFTNFRSYFIFAYYSLEVKVIVMKVKQTIFPSNCPFVFVKFKQTKF